MCICHYCFEARNEYESNLWENFDWNINKFLTFKMCDELWCCYPANSGYLESDACSSLPHIGVQPPRKCLDTTIKFNMTNISLGWHFTVFNTIHQHSLTGQWWGNVKRFVLTVVQTEFIFWMYSFFLCQVYGCQGNASGCWR